MNPNSEVVQQLINSNKNNTSIILFCRRQGEPYVCCGRLEYVGHVEAVVEGFDVLRFVWQLGDTGSLDERPDFQELLTKENDK